VVYPRLFALCLNTFVRRRTTKNTQPDVASVASPERIRSRTFQRAAKLLAAKPRSIAELRERLLERQGVTEILVEEVISRLKEYGYLDDERYALSYASLKVKQHPIGRRRLQQALKMKQVPGTVADEALDLVYAETPEDELIDRAIEKRIRLRGQPKTRLEAKSLFDHLLRQGFAFELVSDRVRRISKTELDE
jgi:regulatory protein